MPRGNPPIEVYKNRIINEAAQAKKTIVIRGVRYYKTIEYTRKTDNAKVIAYYDPTNNEGFRVEFTKSTTKIVPMQKRKKKHKTMRQQEQIQYPPPEHQLSKLMEDKLTRLNYQWIIDYVTYNINLPRNGYAITKEETEIPIVVFNGGYKLLTGVLQDIARLFFPKDPNGVPLRVHYRVTGTFKTPEGNVVKGHLEIPDQLKLEREGFSIERYLAYIDGLAERIGIDPAVLFVGITKHYLGISTRYYRLLIEGFKRFNVDTKALEAALELDISTIIVAIEKSFTGIILNYGGIEIAFVSVDSTKFSRFSTRDPLLLLEAIVDIFSGNALGVSIGEKPSPPKPYVRVVFLLGDGEYFSEEFIRKAFEAGLIPVIRPRRDTPYARGSSPFLRAYAVFFWRYLWWIYRLRPLVERFFSYLSKRGKLLSRGLLSAGREVLFDVLAKNLASCVSLGRLGEPVVVSL